MKTDNQIVLTHLTKREHFASLVMQAMIAASGSEGAVDFHDDTVAKNAVNMADALLKELSRRRTADD